MIHKRSFTGVKCTGMKPHLKAGSFIQENGELWGQEVLCFEDNKGRDWYDLREDDKWGFVIATWPDGHIGAYMEAKSFCPCESHDVWEINPEDMPTTKLNELYGVYGYDGKAFYKLADK